jgi:hypothetical protein
VYSSVFVLCLNLAEHTPSIIEEKGKRASKGWNNGIQDSGVPFIDGMVLTLPQLRQNYMPLCVRIGKLIPSACAQRRRECVFWPG